MVGAATINAPLIVPSNNHAEFTGATITLAPGSNCNLLQNSQVVVNNGRDSNIEVIGGTWDKGGNGGTLTELHGLTFRRVDGLWVRDLKYKSTAGKYGINVRDVKNSLIEGIDFAPASDGVHINGPTTNGVVRRITGSTYDDSVAITGNDYSTYNDVYGDVTNVLIEDMNTISTGANNARCSPG